MFLLVIIFVAAVYSGMAGEETQRIRIGTSRPPAYFPGNGVSVTFSENDCFTFLWPKKWSSKSELKFLLVKLKDGQKPEEAILSNTPVFQQDGIKTHYLDYPLKADPLDYGEYVWQLQNEKGKVLLRTQFNIDSIGNSGYEVERVDNGWMYMKEKLDGSYHDADDKILKIVDALKLCVNDNGARHYVAISISRLASNSLLGSFESDPEKLVDLLDECSANHDCVPHVLNAIEVFLGRNNMTKYYDQTTDEGRRNAVDELVGESLFKNLKDDGKSKLKDIIDRCVHYI